MIINYQIRTMKNNEEVLVLYLSLNEEFSNEWFSKIKNETFKEFIKNHNIIWNGTKVFLVVGSVVLAILNYPSITNDYDYDYIPENVVINEVVDTNEKIEVSDEISEVIEGDQKQEEEVEDNKNVVKEEIKKPVDSGFVNDNHENSSNKNNGTTSIPSTNPISPPKEEVIIPDNKEEVVEEEKITVYRSNGQVVSLSVNDYLIGVVAAEMPASFNIEALKAQSILARTYLRKSQSVGKKLTDTVDTQRYIDKVEMKNMWGSSYNTYYSKIESAVNLTNDLVVTYQGNLIDAVYHSTSNGKTEDSVYVWGNSIPYLKSVSSSWDINASSYFRSVEFDKNKFLSTFGITDDTYNLEILSRNSSGRVEFIKIGDKVYTGVEVRMKLGLRSTDFDIYLQDNIVKIDTKGYGHGVGMSQYGANGMAKEGYSYLQIIKHYYSGVEVISLL